MRRVLKALGRGLRAVIDDREIQRHGKKLAVLVLIRLLIAAGASAQAIEIIQKLA